MTTITPEIDPITREVVQNALASAADEMSTALYRTAYSTIVRDCLDYSTSLCDAEGRMIAQGVTIPLHLGSVPFAMETLFKKFGGDMHPGDVFILNDPFEGGMHIPDIFIVRPVFWEGKRVAFAVSTAHHLDLGGRLPGSSACDNTEIFQEGLRIPWLRLYRRGTPDESIFALIRANVRVPRMTVGDIRAQLSACHIGERAVHDLIRRYGPEMFSAYAADLIGYTERLVRAEIASWPDGSHTFVDHMDSDGVGGPPVRIQVTVTVAGDTLTADFTGTDPQVRGAINATLSFTAAVVALCVRCLMREEIPNTAGIFRPLRVIAPEGTVVNVRMPGASSMRGVTGFRMTDVMFGALARLLPGRVLAAGEGGNTLVVIGGQRANRTPYVYYELLSGTWGARPDRDGNDGLCNPANVASNIPIEQAEGEYPVRIERYGLVRDSGGAGRFRGGLGIEREWTLLSGEAHLAIRSDRRDHLPYGLSGGGAGTGSVNVLHRADGGETLPTMISASMRAGERIYHRQAGGGGFGDPLLRDPEAVARDVRNEKVSLKAAREEYGVALDEGTLEVDEEGTGELRKQMSATRKEGERMPASPHGDNQGEGWAKWASSHSLWDGFIGAIIGAVVGFAGALFVVWQTHAQWKNEQMIEAYLNSYKALQEAFVHTGYLPANYRLSKTALALRDTAKFWEFSTKGLQDSEAIIRSMDDFALHSVVIGKLRESRDSQEEQWRRDLIKVGSDITKAAQMAANGDTSELSKKQATLDNLRIEVFNAANADIAAIESLHN